MGFFETFKLALKNIAGNKSCNPNIAISLVNSEHLSQ